MGELFKEVGQLHVKASDEVLHAGFEVLGLIVCIECFLHPYTVEHSECTAAVVLVGQDCELERVSRCLLLLGYVVQVKQFAERQQRSWIIFWEWDLHMRRACERTSLLQTVSRM